EIIQSFYQEAVLMMSLQHLNVVRVYGVDQTTFGPQLALVSEWMPYGTVSSYLRCYPEASRLQLALDIATGLEYLHNSHVVHGDLKSTNILVNNSRNACIGDFGLAAMHYSSQLTRKSLMAGSVRWMSPELIDPEGHGLEKCEPTPASDIYALAMVFWELFTGRLPFYEIRNDVHVIANILQNARPRRYPEAIRLGMTDNLWSLLGACWMADRDHRPTIAQVSKELHRASEDYGP
ncbi:hypothetical protein CERSUDRAFT_46015, partial [Gelatoporia subvermispora B]